VPASPTRPVNNITDARTIANRDNLRRYVIVGSSITLDQDHIGWAFQGQGNAIVNCGGYNVSASEFTRCEVTGTMVAPSFQVVIDEGKINNLTNFWGSIGRAIFEGTLLLAPGDTTINSCASNVAGPGSRPVIDMGGVAKDLSIRQWSGGLTLEDCITGSNVSIDLVSGHIYLDATCTGGDIDIRGVGQITDNSSSNIDKTGLVEGQDTRLARQIASNKIITDPDTGILTIYDDDNNVLLTASIFEDAAGTIPYRGQGAERREKLS
jgi:hypothetical protein